MPGILRANSRLFADKGTLPPGPLAIDWTLAPRGLSALIVGNFPYSDLVSLSPSFGYKFATPLSVAPVPSAFGNAYLNTDTSNYDAVPLNFNFVNGAAIEAIFQYTTTAAQSFVYVGLNGAGLAGSVGGNAANSTPAVGANNSTATLQGYLNGSFVGLTGVTTMVVGNYYHAVLTWDASGNVQLYLNGKLEASTTGVTIPSQTSAAFAVGTNNVIYGAQASPVVLASCANVNWSAAEVLQRFLDPFSFLVPAGEPEMPGLPNLRAAGFIDPRSRSSKFAFPGGVSPRFDLKHPSVVARGGALRFAAVSLASGGAITSQGQLGTNNPGSFGIDGNIGPYLNYPKGNNTTFPATSFTDTQATIAGILRYNSNAYVSGDVMHFLDNILVAGTGGWGLGTDGTSVWEWQVAGGGGYNAAMPFGPAVSVPYFVALSWATDGTNGFINFLDENLQTGVVRTYQHTFNGLSTVGASSSTVICYGGGRPSGSTSSTLQGSLAAAMWSSAFLSMPEMLAWAEDPWSLWYPNPMDKLLYVNPGSIAPPLDVLMAQILM